MKEQQNQIIREEVVLDVLDELYLEAKNKKDIDYWAPLSKIIMESVELRDSKEMSQADLANLMKTTQSVISRFENMGRIPNYDFIARLAFALGHAPGMTLYGDFMGVVPLEKQSTIKRFADENRTSPRKFVQSLLDLAINSHINCYEFFKKIDDLQISVNDASKTLKVNKIPTAADNTILAAINELEA